MARCGRLRRIASVNNPFTITIVRRIMARDEVKAVSAAVMVELQP
jgi:hypothetical protein